MVQLAKQMTVDQFDDLFLTDEACKSYLQARRWPHGVSCPRCGNASVYELHARPFHWLCRGCNEQGYRFSVTVETIFEDTKVGLRDWFKVIYMMLTSKNGIAALEVQRVMGFGSYKTAHYMCHRIRAALVDPEFRKLMGIVEVDETYVGGKNKNRHDSKKLKGGGVAHKVTVIGAASRDGAVVVRALQAATKGNGELFVKYAVSEKVDIAATDESAIYADLEKNGFFHQTVNHSEGEDVRGIIHTQSIDSFWSLLKRGIMGTFHNVSAKYLPLNVAEFEWRYNNRTNPDIFGAAVGRC
jgi:transposase-like protein